MKIHGTYTPRVKILSCELHTRLHLPLYLPHGYNDLTHAEQRIAFQFMSIAIQNVAAEFQPQWGPIVRKLRIQKILPAWSVPRHEM